LLIFDLARFTSRGSFGVTAGRNYGDQKQCGWTQSIGDLIEVIFGCRNATFVWPSLECAGSLASARRYQVPEVLIAIGQDDPDEFVDRSRVSIGFDEAADYGIGFSSDEDVMFWWEKNAYFAKQVIEGTRRFAEQYKLTATPPFKGVLPTADILSTG